MTIPSARGSGRFMAWFGILLLVLYLVSFGGGWFGIYAVEVRILSLLLIGLALGTWLVVAIRRPEWRPRSAIWPALAAPLLAFAISTALSRNPRISVEYLAWSVLLTCLYLFCQRLLADEFFRPRLMGLTVILCAAIGLLYVVVCFQAWVTWWGLVGHLAVPPLRPGFASLAWGNPGAVMTMAVLFLAPAVAHLGFGTPGRRLTAVALTFLTLVVTVLTGSRAGWLGLVIGIAITAIAWLLVAENRASVRRLASGRTARLAGIAGLIVLGGLAAVLGPSVLFRTQAGGESLRGSYYSAAIRMAADAPVVGSGPGMWVAQRIAYTQPNEVDYYIPHAHNIYLQTLAEFGILGAIAGLIAIGCLLWLIRTAISDPDAIRRRYGWAVLFTTAYFGAHQLLDFYPNLPAILFAFALPIAWLDATSPRSVLRLTLGGGVRRLPAGGIVVAAVLSIGVLAWSESSAIRLNDALAAANGGDWTAALPPATAAAQVDPDMPPNQFTLGLVAAHAGDLDSAASAFEASAKADGLPEAWLDLAATESVRGHPDAERAALRNALQVGRQQIAVNFAAGDLYLKLVDRESARAAFVAAITQGPSLAGDPYWTSTPDMAAMWPSILDRAIATVPPEQGLDIALSAGEPERASAIASTISDPAGRQFAELAIAAWTGSDVAYAALQDRVDARPLDLGALAWTARIAARRGDHAAAKRYRDWMELIAGESSAATNELRVADASASDQHPAGMTSAFYGHYTYRRPTPWDQLVPNLLHLKLE